MNGGPVWYYDEFRQVGKDYSCRAEVDVYDTSHAKFRDFEAESLRILELLEIGPIQKHQAKVPSTTTGLF